MSAHPGAGIRQRRLGSELRRLREEAKVSQRDASAHIDGGQAKLSKIETGRQNIRRLELLALLDLYGVADPELREVLVSLLPKSRRPGWWHEYGNALRTDSLDIISLEAECEQILQYCNVALPELLQTDEYARALIGGLDPHLPDEQVQFFVHLRIRRQHILHRADPPRFVAVLDEALLRRPVGGPGTMARQLRGLVEMSRRPRTTIQVVPTEQAVYPGMYGSFRVLYSSPPAALNVVETDHWTGSRYADEPGQVESHRLLHDTIRSSALSSQRSLELISQLSEEFDDRDGAASRDSSMDRP
ncbi:helix-turn-helix domain-containing protein [Streptomyces sp. NPDC092369]|uniref:helix-turn-helix domain-containing protein n=1 Tax=Streptomyces sp. NPDC092369 TaxID=3366015 RepID=UPI0038064374